MQAGRRSSNAALAIALLSLVAALGGAKALKRAKQAGREAKWAGQTAASAQSTAGDAQSAAGTAQSTADAAATAVSGAPSAADQAQGSANQTGAKIADTDALRANSLTLSGGQSGTLFTVGEVRLDVTCNVSGPNLQAIILAHTQEGSDGQRLVVDDSVLTLVFDSVDFLIFTASSGAMVGDELSFAIFGDGGASRGIAAATAHQSENRCELRHMS